MTSQEKLRADIERLRVVVALQWLHAKKGFDGQFRVDLAELWKGAHVAAGIQHEGAGDPAVLIEFHLAEAALKCSETSRHYPDGSAQLTRMLRDRGLHNVAKLRAMVQAYVTAGGDRPEGGWVVTYYPWDMSRLRQVGDPRRLVVGGTPEQIARRADAVRGMSTGQLSELSAPQLYLAARAVGVANARPPLNYTQRVALTAQIKTMQGQLPGTEVTEPTPAHAS